MHRNPGENALLTLTVSCVQHLPMLKDKPDLGSINRDKLKKKPQTAVTKSYLQPCTLFTVHLLVLRFLIPPALERATHTDIAFALQLGNLAKTKFSRKCWLSLCGLDVAEFNGHAQLEELFTAS